MTTLPGRRSCAILLLALVSVFIASTLVSAQTSVVVNPTTLVFTPSPDDNLLLSNGLPAVESYSFDVYSVGAAQPFQRTNIGKPAPASDGLIHYDFSSGVAAWPLPGGNYEARVAAIGSTGTATSGPSNAFTFSSCTYALSGTSASLPAAGGGTQVSVTTSSGCTWTAASNVSWVALSASGGTGNGTIVMTVAANGATTSRTGTVTVGGKAFTINQAGTAVASAPAVPSSPSPTSGATSVSQAPTLTWTASGATSYSVAFGTTNPPAQRASGLTSASYAPGTLSASTTYYWRVTATNSAGSTAGAVWSFTTAASATTTPALPSPWKNQDIGSVGLTGSASYSGTTFSATGSGADIWGTADGFQYVYQPITGNVEIVARMTGEQNTNQYAKAGVMLREALTASSAHVILDVVPSGSVEFMTRAAAGGATSYLAGSTQAAPAWLKLNRVGSTVTAAVSADGATWRTVGSTTVSMATTMYVGLAVTSHSTTVRNTATFDAVSVTPLTSATLPAPWANQDLGSVGLAGSTSYSAGQFTVTGAGSDIWGSADSFQFAYQPLNGDGQITARMAGEQNTNTYAKAGVMLRSTLTAGSADVILDVVPNGSVEFMARTAAGGSTTYLGGTTQAPPTWLRLVRSGTTVTASVSADGVTWRTVGTTSVSLGTSVYAGLAVTSHNTSLRNTARFDNVTVK